ncbi:hypothetical protein DL98DRAFT_596594 [Cadophora sp. DSE1049]|nr:hypothetical protein DL98DRAFT_596594 [Cadophora sp. DSE1049]
MSSPGLRAHHDTNMDTNRLVVSELTPTGDEHGVSNVQPGSKEGLSITIENLNHIPPRREPYHMDYQLSPTQHQDERTNLSIIQCPSTSAPKVHHSDKQASLPKCPARSSIYFGKSNWRTVLNILISVYSTAFSVIWLAIAIVRPRYGPEIHIGRTYFAPSTASTLFALFAKTIEISSVTVFITFLGQVLTRRSMHSPGVTVADMAIRTWIVQPGFIFTHWNHFKHVGFTILGVTSFLAALAILLFTTASDALVSPHLKYTGWEDSTMYSHVRGFFANPDFMESTCKIPGATTDIFKGTVCMTLQDAGLSYTDLNSWLDIWADIEANGIGAPDDLKYRPTAISSIFPNATVKGSWVQTQAYSVPNNYAKFGRIINNVTLSMPHSGVYSASEQPRNQITSARSIHASMVSPSSNVMCVNMNRSELAPLIYVEWPAAVLLNTTGSPGGIFYNPYQKFPAPGYQQGGQ